MNLEEAKNNAPDGAIYFDGQFYYMFGAYGYWYIYRDQWRQHSKEKPSNAKKLN